MKMCQHKGQFSFGNEYTCVVLSDFLRRGGRVVLNDLMGRGGRVI